MVRAHSSANREPAGPVWSCGLLLFLDGSFLGYGSIARQVLLSVKDFLPDLDMLTVIVPGIIRLVGWLFPAWTLYELGNARVRKRNDSEPDPGDR